MFTVKTLPKEDYQFAVDLANTMNWNMAVEDFEFMASLEPDSCLLLLDGAKRVGVATCNNYGKMGWFGNLIVEEKYRKKGAGTALVTHAIKQLHAKGVETIGLYAYRHLECFYGNLGFKADKDFAVLQAKDLQRVKADPLPKIGTQQLPEIISFDSENFGGGNRSKLLESIICTQGNASFYISEGCEVVGYVAATIYESMAWLGPLVCTPSRNDIALPLIKAALSEMAGRTVYAVLPKTEAKLLEAFLGLGFREDFSVSRMFLGKAPTKNCIYMAESLERG
ncbi:MAG: GNAT family N-acetyltransferase [Candidatus Bathyarchaeota archaeon]|nr:GNAT family N-acetyltransferase [Candidatus Bathyarchaeota archaeon]